MILLSIDSSINNCGYALFKDDKLFTYGLITACGYIASDIESLICKTKEIVTHIEHIILVYGLEKSTITIVAEYPAKFEGYKGIGAKDSGSLNKLCFLCGALYARFNCKFVRPYEWKGQLSKTQLEDRLIKVYPNIKGMDHNIIDAVGIGYWYINGELPK